MSRLLSAAALVATAAAQDWGTTGAWETIVPRTPGPAWGMRKPTAVAGCLVVPSNNTQTNNLNAWSYDIFQNTWTQWPDITTNIQDPFLFEMGGQVVFIDEMNPQAIAFIDSVNINGGWTYKTVVGGPTTQRFGQRFVAWGSTLYMFGGLEVATLVAHNDLWALDMAAVMNGNAGLLNQWVQVAADNTPGLPPARIGYSWTPFGVGITLMGGVSLAPNAPAGMDPRACFGNSPNQQYCVYHRHVWAFIPGNQGIPKPNSITGANWLMMNDVGAYNGPTPTGRFMHTAGAMGDQLFIFGGATATGPSAEMWAYNLVSQTYQQVAQNQPWPSAATDLGFGAGTVIGRHLYQYIQQLDPVSGFPMPGTGQLWRWAPSASAGSVAPPAPNAIHPGAVAGIVIGILVGIANLVLLIALARNEGVMSLAGLGCGCIGGGVSLPSFGGAAKSAPAGFYSSSTSGAGMAASDSLANGGYEAPPA